MSESTLLQRNGWHFYPEKKAVSSSGINHFLEGKLCQLKRRRLSRHTALQAFTQRVNGLGETFGGMSNNDVSLQILSLRKDFVSQGLAPDLAVRSFALVREAAFRTIRQRHYDVQVQGGYILLNGMAAEMETGEGKTLTATLAACTAALAGIPVHIITVNDYLVQRDAEWMGPIYQFLGLTVGTIIQGMSLQERRGAYSSDVTYCTNKEIVFDYLKDRLVLKRWPGEIRARLGGIGGKSYRDSLCLKGLCFGIIDEVDSILIDEARTPLIISGMGNNNMEGELCTQALSIAGELRQGEDFYLDKQKRTPVLTGAGKIRLSAMAKELGGFWQGRNRREEWIRQALSALYLFQRDKDYLVRDDKVLIIDEFTGRIMPDRSWEKGLHQLIEVKESCRPTVMKETLAKISYQRFFQRYLHLAGMTGTAREIAGELWSVYRLHVVKVPTHRPLIRRAYPPQLFRTEKEKWQAVVARIGQMHAKGRPVLIGTRSVATSEHLSSLLAAAGFPHRILNAKQDREEADIIAEAGQTGRITVATNMAGRGTDIVLSPEACEAGGLHVIVTERHEAGRIDRQLSGRCGRQGDPGSFEIFQSMEDEIMATYLSTMCGYFLRSFELRRQPGRFSGCLLAKHAQQTVERKHFHMRKALLKMDQEVEKALAFSGKGE